MNKRTFRIPDEIHQKAKQAAAKSYLSLNSWLVQLLRRELEREQKEEKVKKIPFWPSGWPKNEECFFCGNGVLHDPIRHGLSESFFDRKLEGLGL